MDMIYKLFSRNKITRGDRGFESDSVNSSEEENSTASLIIDWWR
jgi:hypothetical protein